MQDIIEQKWVADMLELGKACGLSESQVHRILEDARAMLQTMRA